MALKITQVKGLVGTKPNHRANIEALGLKRIGHSVVKQDTPIIRGINGTELVDLVLKYYDQLSVKYRKMIPLKMVYIPVPPEE